MQLNYIHTVAPRELNTGGYESSEYEEQILCEKTVILRDEMFSKVSYYTLGNFRCL